MHLLLIKNVSFFVFNQINLHLAEAECIGISGASGSGKTRLLRVIADLEPHEGEIFLRDTNLKDTPPQLWRKRVGLLPAESQWWFDRVGDHFIDPDLELICSLGFDADVLQWEVNRLSTGEKQRLALARMLQNKPQVLLLDEPTANLDVRYIARVEKILLDYKNAGAGLLWVSHDPQQLQRVADKSYHIHKNELVPQT